MNNLFRDFLNGLVEVRINNKQEYDAFMHEVGRSDPLMMWESSNYFACELPYEYLTTGTIYIKVNSYGNLVYRGDSLKIVSFKEIMNNHEE